MERILENFKHRGHESGGELYLGVSEAREFLRALRDARIAVLGVEAVRCENKKIRPLIDQIADFSSLSTEDWNSRVEASSRAAARFLDQLPEDSAIMVTFTVTSGSEAGR